MTESPVHTSLMELVRVEHRLLDEIAAAEAECREAVVRARREATAMLGAVPGTLQEDRRTLLTTARGDAAAAAVAIRAGAAAAAARLNDAAAAAVERIAIEQAHIVLPPGALPAKETQEEEGAP